MPVVFFYCVSFHQDQEYDHLQLVITSHRLKIPEWETRNMIHTQTFPNFKVCVQPLTPSPQPPPPKKYWSLKPHPSDTRDKEDLVILHIHVVSCSGNT